jgi:hypothetical protein
MNVLDQMFPLIALAGAWLILLVAFLVLIAIEIFRWKK